MTDIKLAIAPIGWSNDDMPELGAHISFEQCINEMAEAGYQGCEVGHKFPRDPDLLSAALGPRSLNIASAWYSIYFTEEGRTQASITGFIEHMNFLKAMNAKVIVVCECGHSIQGRNVPVLQRKPVFTPEQWGALIAGLHHLGKLAAANDMRIVYHHHMGTGIQSESDIDRLMLETNPDLVSLLFDTGHLCFAGHDPLVTLRKHASRIKHVHLKDCRAEILTLVKDKSLSFLEAVREGVFTVPGDGCLDFAPIFTALREANYQGWWVVEAEQDPDKATPLVYAKKARTFLRDLAGV